jgi:chromosome segregation ATPase
MDQELIAYLDERFRETSQQIQGLREETTQQLTSFRAEVDRRFEQVDKRFEQVDKRFEQVDKRFEQVDERLDHLQETVHELQETVHGTQILVEDLRGKIELVAEGVVGVNERLDAALEKTGGEFQEVWSVFSAHNKNLDGRLQAVEKRTARHTRQIAALRSRPKKAVPGLS